MLKWASAWLSRSIVCGVPTFRESRAHALVWRLSGLTVIRVLSAVAPLATLPVIARYATTADWAALGIGTSLGTVGAVLVNLGWSLTGPPRVAGQDFHRASRVLSESRASSLAAFYVVIPVGAVASALLAPTTARGLAGATTVAMTTAGLSATWHITAQGRTRDLVTYDVIPRLVAAFSGAAMVALVGRAAIWTYPLALGLAGLLGPYLYAQQYRTTAPTDVSRRVLVVRQSTPALTGLLGAIYSGLAVALIAIVTTTPEVASLSSGLRMYLAALSAIVIVNQATISWAVSGVGPAPRELRTAGALSLTLALLGVVCFATVGPAIGRTLFSDEHVFDVWTSAALGVAFAALTLHTFVNTHLLLPFGRTRAGLHATIAGALVGVPSTLVLGDAWGASGGATGVALAETTVAVYLVGSALRRRAAHTHD